MLRSAEHRKPKPAPIFGAPFAVIVIGLVCGLVGATVWTRSRTTGLVLLVLAFCAFGAMTYLYRRED